MLSIKKYFMYYCIRRCLAPLTTVTLPNSEGGLNKSDFIFAKFIFKKIGEKFESIKFFKFDMSILTIIHILI